jgi:hypothetical protein
MGVYSKIMFNSVLPCHARTLDYNREELLPFMHTRCLKLYVFTCFWTRSVLQQLYVLLYSDTSASE